WFETWQGTSLRSGSCSRMAPLQLPTSVSHTHSFTLIPKFVLHPKRVTCARIYADRHAIAATWSRSIDAEKYALFESRSAAAFAGSLVGSIACGRIVCLRPRRSDCGQDCGNGLERAQRIGSLGGNCSGDTPPRARRAGAPLCFNQSERQRIGRGFDA